MRWINPFRERSLGELRSREIQYTAVQLHESRLALERYEHTVRMLEQRLARLQHEQQEEHAA